MKKANKCHILLSFPILALSFGLFVHAAAAKDFYVDPAAGSMTNDGSQAHPWSTFQEVWSSGKINTRQYSVNNPVAPFSYLEKNVAGPVHGGDTIYLLSGFHGSIDMWQALNTDYITVKAAPGADPRFGRMHFLACSKWIFDGISISPSYSSASLTPAYIYSVDSNSFQGPNSEIILRNSSIFSVPSIAGFTAEDWTSKTFSGALLYGTESSIIDNVHIYNINTGIGINKSPHSEVRNSMVENFRSDGLIAYQSDYSKIEYNTIKNAYDLTNGTGVHTDMMQFSSDGILEHAFTGLEVRGNTVIAHEDGKQPFIGPTQGISGFDGFYKGFVIENNLVEAGTNHGMSYYGAIGCRIMNNTLVIPWASDTYQQSPIMVFNHKNGTPSTGNIVRNNIASNVYLVPGSGVADSNAAVLPAVYGNYFTDHAGFDFSLKQSSPAIDAGSIDLAPTIDIAKNPRDSRPDIGAYEYGIPSPVASYRADVNGSSSITSADALLAMRYSLGLSMTGTGWQASATTGDANCDGKVTASDALLILRYSLGLSMGGTAWCL